MTGPSATRIAIWIDEDGETLDFSPTRNPAEIVLVKIPDGARLVSHPDMGIMIMNASGELDDPSGVMEHARESALGYSIVDVLRPDPLL